jgi:NTP pyrophosphatase (non-canonical NTP hydrolase)
MARWKIAVNADYRALLQNDMLAIQSRQRELQYAGTPEEIPLYPEFVNNLMSEMNTPSDELHHACTGLAGEAGEVLDLSKKVWAYGKALDVAKLVEELGDVRFYYQATLNMLGITDEEIRAQNIKKLRARFPSGTFSKKDAIERKDKSEERDFMRDHHPVPRG